MPCPAVRRVPSRSSGPGTASQQTSEEPATNLIGAPGTTMIQPLAQEPAGAEPCARAPRCGRLTPSRGTRNDASTGRSRAHPRQHRVPRNEDPLAATQGQQAPLTGLRRQESNPLAQTVCRSVYGRSAPCEEDGATRPQSLVPRPLRALGTTLVPLCHEDRKIGSNFWPKSPDKPAEPNTLGTKVPSRGPKKRHGNHRLGTRLLCW